MQRNTIYLEATKPAVPPKSLKTLLSEQLVTELLPNDCQLVEVAVQVALILQVVLEVLVVLRSTDHLFDFTNNQAPEIGPSWVTWSLDHQRPLCGANSNTGIRIR